MGSLLFPVVFHVRVHHLNFAVLLRLEDDVNVVVDVVLILEGVGGPVVEVANVTVAVVVAVLFAAARTSSSGSAALAPPVGVLPPAVAPTTAAPVPPAVVVVATAAVATPVVALERAIRAHLGESRERHHRHDEKGDELLVEREGGSHRARCCWCSEGGRDAVGVCVARRRRIVENEGLLRA